MSGEIRIYPLLTGEADINTDLDMFWSLSKEKVVVTVPILAYLVKTRDGPVLVDTGFRSASRAMEVHKLGPHRWKPEWDIRSQLERFGVKPGDVKYVILTHLHYDHAGRCSDFPNASFVVQRKELKEAAAPISPPNFEVGGKALFYDRLDVQALVGDLWDRVVLLDGDEEIVNGVRCVLLEDSHTPGSQVVYVETDKGIAVILGDVARKVELNIERRIPPALYYDLRSMQEALARIKREGKIFLPAHDYEVYHRYSEGI
ncbi:MAG: N-acyl homoserine lactonase family protein [Conexivisphaera sp.]